MTSPRPSLSRWTLASCAPLLGALLLSGCGCTYGSASPPTVTPETTCLAVQVTGGCIDFDMTVTNNCADALTFTGGAEPLVVAPGATQALSPFAYGDQVENGETCQGTSSLPARLGEAAIQIEFTFEMVNRGLFGC